MISLKPFKGKKKIKETLFSTFDIEGSDWIKFLCGAAAWRCPLTNKIDSENFLSIEEYLDFAFSEDHPFNLVFAHAGGIYDFDFILDRVLNDYKKYKIVSGIQRTNGFLSLKIGKIEKSESGEEYFSRIIEYRDSTGILPFSLDSISKNFDVSHKKLKMDVSKLKKVTKKLLEYNRYDCIALFESLEKYRDQELIKSVGMAPTMASQSLKVFRKYLYQEIPSLTKYQDKFVRKSYFGGRTEVYKPLFESKNNNDLLYYYDVNSLYPYQMLFDVPTIPTEKKIKNIESEMGFVDCTVKVPDMYLPPLPACVKIFKNEKLVFPVGEFRGVFSTIELTYAMSLGVKIKKIHNSMKFENGGKIFKNYIEDMYKRRLNSPKNSVDNILAKLLMNSLYGRFGLETNREELVFDACHPDEGMSLHSSLLLDDGSRHDIYLRKTKLEKSFNNVAISSWITSRARIHIHKKMLPVQDLLYYGDTDSMLVQKELDSNENELGELKLELKAKKGAFLLPKTYYLENDEGLIKKDDKIIFSKATMKGFSNKDVQKFKFEDFVDQFEGEIRLRTGAKQIKAKLRSALKQGSVLAYKSEQGRSVQAVYDKRRIIKKDNGEYDTEPLAIRDGEAVNIDAERQSKLYYKIKEKEKFRVRRDVYLNDLKLSRSKQL